MGTIVGIYLAIALYADGSLTQNSGGVVTTVVSASVNTTSAWQFVSIVPVLLTVSAALFAIYRVGKAI